MPSLIRTTRVSQVNVGAGPTVVAGASTHPNPRPRHPNFKRTSRAIFWSAQLAEKDMLALVPTGVHVAHLLTTLPPLVSRPFRPGGHAEAVLAAEIKGQVRVSIALQRRTASVLPSTPMEMLL